MKAGNRYGIGGIANRSYGFVGQDFDDAMEMVGHDGIWAEVNLLAHLGGDEPGFFNLFTEVVQAHFAIVRNVPE